MKLKFYKRIPFKLMRASLTVAFVLGVLLALVQVYTDFRAHRHYVDEDVAAIFRVSQNAAQRAVHLLDTRLAEEVVSGFQHYSFVAYAAIYDDSGEAMAEYNANHPSSSTQWITDLAMARQLPYEQELIYSDGTYEGKIVLRLDSDEAMSPFYERATTIFVSGLLRNMVLALVLMVLYHYVLARPLIRLSERFTQIEPGRESGHRLHHLPGHEDDELGYIINSANSLLSVIEQRQLGLEQSKAQLRIILDSSPNQMFALNRGGDFVFLNNTTAEFYGVKEQDLLDQNYYRTHRRISSAEANSILINIKQVDANNRANLSVEQKLTSASGELYSMQLSYIPFQFNGDPCVLIIGLDITGRVKAEQRVEHLAYFDHLTDLPNRNMFYDQLQRDIAYAHETGTYGALIFIDLDDFKRINDTLGHSLGDQLLQRIGRSIAENKRSTDTLARSGGDEFVLSIPNIDTTLGLARRQIINHANRLLRIINTPIALQNREFTVSASLGIITYPYGECDTESLMKFADTAMYKAKQAGRNCFKIFEESMAAEAADVIRLESELRLAISEDQLFFRLQPIVDISDGEVVAAEALVRWRHPEKGVVSPAMFIDFLERSSMIKDLDYSVFDKACFMIKDFLDRDVMPDRFKISVNVSATTLHHASFIQVVESTLQKYSLPGHHLEFELTEGAALLNIEEIIEKLERLSKSGISFALDDFGTGYSSLTYLKKIPLQKIKIDRSFVQDLLENEQDEALVASIIAIGEKLNIRVVAEGVENIALQNWLSKHNAILCQGFLYDQAIDIDEFEKKYFINQHRFPVELSTDIAAVSK